MYRSEDVFLYKLVTTRGSVYDILSILGQESSVQFVDADEQNNPQFSRKYFQQVKLCEDLAQRVEHIRGDLKKNGYSLDQCEDLEGWSERWSRFPYQQKFQTQAKDFLYHLQQQIIKDQQQLEQKNFQLEAQLQHRNKLIELKTILNIHQQIFGAQVVNLNLVAGTVDQEELLRFERSIFRATKGNALVQTNRVGLDSESISDNLIDLKTRKIKEKVAFLIFVPLLETDSTNFQNKITKICEAFQCNLYEVPKTPQQLQTRLAQTAQDIADINTIISQAEQDLDRVCQNLVAPENSSQDQQTGRCSRIEDYRLYLIKEKLIYTTMNYFIPNNTREQKEANLLQPNLNNESAFLIGYLWVPPDKMDSIQEKISSNLHRQNQNQSIQVSLFQRVTNFSISPPTYYNTNSFTKPFQEIVETYGIATYKEANPALFTIVTFPFLYGVMFGDIGHGSLLLVLGIYLLNQQQSLGKSKDLNALISVKYMVTMMGFFALYCGLIYNDFLSMSLNLFGSCWEEGGGKSALGKGEGCNYVFGVDPIWGVAENKLTFYNSLKMKLAVILGVLQMILGIFVKGSNAIYFRSSINFFCEFIPQIIFMCCTFGYMCLMIIWKWNTDYTHDTSKAPSLLNAMLNFGLNLGDWQGVPLFENQEKIQKVLITLALISVPWMLLIKPILLSRQHHPSQSQNGEHHQLVEEEEEAKQGKGEIENSNLRAKEQQHEFSEIMIHQAIECIEFVLGSISHTASYLRLWALSLAHSQLSEVFFTKCLGQGLAQGNVLSITLGFTVLACITFGVLMCMDAMECFLHTLRLHWVEFQSKFYKAEGYRFTPFSIQQAIYDEIQK